MTTLEFELEPGMVGIRGDFVAVVAFRRDGGAVFVRPDEAGRAWELPGGHIEAGETAVDAGLRELEEEAGVRLTHAHHAATITARFSGDPRARIQLVTGIVESGCDVLTRDVQWAVATPSPATFGAGWSDLLVAEARRVLTERVNQDLWEQAGDDYLHNTEISSEIVHYSPLIAGEDQLGLLPPLEGMSVADLGAGGGHNLAALRHMGARRGVGVERSPSAARQAWARLGTAGDFHISIADIEQVKLRDLGPFDVVITVFALPFISNPRSLFREVAAALNPGGTFVVATDHPRRFGGVDRGLRAVGGAGSSAMRIREWRGAGEQPIQYVHHAHSTDFLVAALAEAGLEVDRTLEPLALSSRDLHRAPYRSAYHLSRHAELARAPYSLIVRARRPPTVAQAATDRLAIGVDKVAR